MHKPSVRIILSMVVALAWLTPSIAAACGQPPVTTPPIKLKRIDDTTWRYRVMEYSTFGASSGSFCVCGLATGGAATSVDSVLFIDPTTGAAVAGFSFSPSATTTGSFNSQMPANWQGFLSPVTQNIAMSQSLELHFFVTVPAGTTFNDLANDLAANGLIGTDEGNSDGTVTGLHLAIVAPGSISAESVLDVPTLSEPTLALLAVVLALAGALLLLRRSFG